MAETVLPVRGRVIVPRGCHPWGYRYGVFEATEGHPLRTSWPAIESPAWIASYERGYADARAGKVQRKGASR